MILRKGTKVTISADWDWKYGEPSIYKDEMLWYLMMKVGDDILEHDDEDKVLKRLETTYEDLLSTIKKNGTVTIKLP